MARPIRLQGEGFLYHITSRGDNRKRVFISDDDCEKFLDYLKAAKDKFKFYLYAYCLMDNHYHLFFETTQGNLSRIMHSINTAYTTYYNVKRRKSGHLFQGRYKALLVERDSYFMELTRYIHLNPVRANMVNSPDKYKWSSFNAYVHPGNQSLIDKEQVDRYFVIDPIRYKTFVLEGIDAKANFLDNIYAGFILGKEKFIKDTLQTVKEHVEGDDISYKRDINNNATIEAIVAFLSMRYNHEPHAIYSAKKKPLLAKKIALYLSKRLTNLTNREIGKAFSITYSAVSKAVQDTERLMEEDKGIASDVKKFISHFKG